MIHENVKFDTLYIRKSDFIQKYFFMIHNNLLYGATRKSEDEDWGFVTWSKILDPKVSYSISKIKNDDLIKLQREALVNFIEAHAEDMK